MDNARSQAYGRVVKTLEQVGNVKLTSDETQIIRTAADAPFLDGGARAGGHGKRRGDGAQAIRPAADALFFDGDGYDELAAVEDLVQQLVDADRWTAASGHRPRGAGRGRRRARRR